jgi:hypothetical protein
MVLAFIPTGGDVSYPDEISSTVGNVICRMTSVRSSQLLCQREKRL